MVVKSPNWCINTLDVTGSKEDIAAFKKYVTGKNGEVFSFEAFLPTPPELLDEQAHRSKKDNPNRHEMLVEKYGAADWYYWRLQHWGCKWDVDATLEEENATHLLYRFDSPWAPPEQGLLYASEHVPGVYLTLEYDEPGMDFWGVTEFHAGEAEIQAEGTSRLNLEWAEQEDVDEDVPLDEE